MKTKQTLIGALSARVSRVVHSAFPNRVLRIAGGSGAAAILLGTTLSIGGLPEALNGLRVLTDRNLDSARGATLEGGRPVTVTNFENVSTSILEVSRAMPGAPASKRAALFGNHGFPTAAPDQKSPHSVFGEEMTRVNDAIRREFFAGAMPYGALIHEKAAKYDVDPALVAAVIEQESEFQPRARSQVGARGLMQLMPSTGRLLGVHDLYDPEQNVDAGVRYIKFLQERFDGNLKKTLAAYNAGEGNVDRYDGIPPFAETRTYVRRVLRNYKRRHDQLNEYSSELRSGAGAMETDGGLALR